VWIVVLGLRSCSWSDKRIGVWVMSFCLQNSVKFCVVSWRRKHLILCVRAAWFLGFVGYSNAGCCEEAFVVRRDIYGSRESLYIYIYIYIYVVKKHL